MGFASLFKTSSAWPFCKQPRTESFRAGGGDDDKEHSMYMKKKMMMINPVYLDSVGSESCSFTEDDSSGSEESSASLSSDSEEELELEPLDTVDIRGMKSDRLFFEPSGDNRYIMKECSKDEEGVVQVGVSPLEEGVAVVAVKSEDPYGDFRASMEEMVAAHGTREDWEYLEELVEWYLKANVNKAHESIVEAFLDMVLDLASSVS